MSVFSQHHQLSFIRSICMCIIQGQVFMKLPTRPKRNRAFKKKPGVRPQTTISTNERSWPGATTAPGPENVVPVEYGQALIEIQHRELHPSPAQYHSEGITSLFPYRSARTDRNYRGRSSGFISISLGSAIFTLPRPFLRAPSGTSCTKSN